MTDLIKAKIQELCPDIILTVLLTDKRKPKICVLSKLAIENGLKPKPHREDGIVIGESKDKRCWVVRWHRKDDTLMARENYSKEYIQIFDEQDLRDGPDITLSVVLRAMQSLSRTDSNRHWVVNRHGEFLKDREDRLGADVGETWNLTKDNYDDQTEETKRFIGSLLGI